jgi:hypothetical protein
MSVAGHRLAARQIQRKAPRSAGSIPPAGVFFLRRRAAFFSGGVGL